VKAPENICRYVRLKILRTDQSICHHLILTGDP
jgi:hypothetical protein